MRPLIEIIAAVKGYQAVEPEEMRLALLALVDIKRQTDAALNDLIAAVDLETSVRRRMQGGEPRNEIAASLGLPAAEACLLPDLCKPKAELARGARERMQAAMQMSPAEWLGAEGGQ